MQPRRALVAVLLGALLASVAATERRHCVILDAGSTGTRVHVYTYELVDGSGSVRLLNDTLGKAEPGLSSFADAPHTAGESLLELLELARATVPASCRGSTPVHLMATAGLRALGGGVADQILVSVRRTLAASGFDARDEWVSILTGEDEALYGYATVNYLIGRELGGEIGMPGAARTFAPEPPLAFPVGVMDLGGASVQIATPRGIGAAAHIAFAAQPAALPAYVTLDLLGEAHAVQLRSYHGYGLNEARARAALLVDGGLGASGTIAHPCLPLGYSEPAPLALGAAATALAAAQTLVGSADYDGCRHLMRALFLKAAADGAEEPPRPRHGLARNAAGTCATDDAASCAAAAAAVLPLSFVGFSFLFDRTAGIGLGTPPRDPVDAGAERTTAAEMAAAARVLCAEALPTLRARYTAAGEHGHARRAHQYCGDVT
jgi:hypothetical protein